jgi:dipeptidyl aminopeptidase/acylaminoacyl peptidase
MRYQDPYAPTIWYTTLEKSNSKWKLGKAPVDALKDTPWLYPWADNAGLGPGGLVKMGPQGILVATMDDINYDAARGFQTALLYIRLKTFTESEPPPPILVQAKETPLGGVASAAFSPDGKTGAMLRQKDIKSSNIPTFYLFLFDLEDPSVIHRIDILNEAQEYWDISPTELVFSQDGSTVYLMAEKRGRMILFAVDLTRTKDEKGFESIIARQLSKSGSVSTVHLIKGNTSSSYPDSLFINSSSMVDNCKYSILYPSSGHEVVISSATENGTLLGLSPAQVSEFSFKSSGDYQVQSFIIRPSGFKQDKKYPCMLAVHGGPAGCWRDAWSWGGNFAMIAEQGYIVILPNITGSSSFGNDFLEAVNGDFGGRPYEDLAACWQYVEDNLNYVDTDRAVAQGGSYGGEWDSSTSAY